MFQIRSKTIVIGILAVLMAALATPGPAIADSDTPEVENEDNYIVAYTSAALSEEAEDYIEAAGGDVSDDWDEIGYAVVSGINDAEAQSLAELSGVTSVTRDLYVRWIPEITEAQLVEMESPPQLRAHDPSLAFFFPIQWNMTQIQADAAWGAGFDATGTLVAILDTGINTTHIDTSPSPPPPFPPPLTPVVSGGPQSEHADVYTPLLRRRRGDSRSCEL